MNFKEIAGKKEFGIDRRMEKAEWWLGEEVNFIRFWISSSWMSSSKPSSSFFHPLSCAIIQRNCHQTHSIDADPQNSRRIISLSSPSFVRIRRLPGTSKSCEGTGGLPWGPWVVAHEEWEGLWGIGGCRQRENPKLAQSFLWSFWASKGSDVKNLVNLAKVGLAHNIPSTYMLYWGKKHQKGAC